MDSTLCTFCRQPIAHQGEGWAEHVADHPVYKCGELAYIEIAHALCAPWDPETGWRIDGEPALTGTYTDVSTW